MSGNYRRSCLGETDNCRPPVIVRLDGMVRFLGEGRKEYDMKRIAVLWCEMDDERDLRNFSQELGGALTQYADLVKQGRAGQHHQCESFVADNGVKVMVIEAKWIGQLAPIEDCQHCSQS
jgi:hypothetical protein